MVTSTASEVADLHLNLALAGKYDDHSLFAKKLKQANQLLAKAGVPKILR